MVKYLRFIIIGLFVYASFLQLLHAQVWYYSFGVDTGSFTSGEDTTFLPSPGANGGTERVRVGSGGGGFYLENPGIAGFGSESELKGVASSSTSYNKFSVYNYSPGNSFTIKFLIRFSGGTGGKWYFFQGDGNCYSNNSSFSTDMVFTGLRFDYITDSTVCVYYRDSDSWKKLSGVTLNQNTNYVIEIWGNNSSSTKNYNYNGVQAVAPNKYDLWVNGELIGDDLPKGGLLDGASIDSWMFYGGSSEGNKACIHLDDIYYANFIYTDGSLPVMISYFNVKYIEPDIKLEWITESEIDNLGFKIYRSINDSEFKMMASFADYDELTGHGTCSYPNNYTFTDRNVTKGSTYSYLLSSVDYDGKETKYIDIVRTIVVPSNDTNTIDNSYNIEIYPNPANIFFNLNIKLERQSRVSISIYDIRGCLIRLLTNTELSSYTNTFRFDCGYLQSGVYLLRIDLEGISVVRKILVIK
ncbi:MAG: T9SS type A sorting domain-containing protein [Candidatus Marinimicrobia bacterium]|nr:T9SS type A sorting domain-containing protein [Candidatus Neomarinimicrobiota bacterium]